MQLDEHTLIVDRLVKRFGSLRAVDELSFAVKPGEIFGLLGPNGAGKTTTIKCILGLLEPNEGNILVFGLEPLKNEIAIKKRLGYVAEEPLIFKSQTPKELFNFIASVRQLDGDGVSKKLAEYMDSLGAVQYYEKSIATLSRGNKQKIQIIAALLHEPALLILDEPLTGLDARAVRVFKEILKMHTERGGSVIFSTHIMEIAEEICDRLAIINKGKIVGVGTMAELRQKLNSSETLENIFLKLTDEDKNVDQIVSNLRKSMGS